MAPRNDIEDSNSNRDNRTPAATTPRLGHNIREIRQQLHHRHHAQARYQVTPTHPPTNRATLMSVTSEEYQRRLYTKSRSNNPKVRLAAVREAIATSPYTWEDLSADGVREWVEPSTGDDALLMAAVESLGDLEPDERHYLGKFVAERIYEILTVADAAYWRRVVPDPRR